MVLVPSQALTGMIREARRAGPLETGGLLVGYQADEPNHFVVTAVVGPAPAARHDYLKFSPDQWWQEKVVSRLYELSGRRHANLGDWHSHPNGPPWPSTQDRRVARLIANSAAARAPEPIMLIVGRKRDRRWMIAGYIQRRYLRRTRIRATESRATIVLGT